MRKTFLALLTLLLVLCSFGVVACSEPEHTHDYNKLKHNATQHWYQCSCGAKDGIEYHKGGEATATEKAICSVCEAEYGEYDELTGMSVWLINNGTEYEVYNYRGSFVDVVIPATYDNKPITSIGVSAFDGCTSIKTISFEQGSQVNNIGKRAFDGCASLESVNLPNGILNIGDYAFQNCKKLASIDLPSSVETIGENAFARCVVLETINIPASVLSIGYGAFYECNLLESITFDQDAELVSIGGRAFESCDKLISVTLPGSLKSIDADAFIDCSAFKNENTVQSAKVNYMGTIDTWAEIEFANNYANPLVYTKNLYINNDTVLSGDISLTQATKVSSYAFINCDSLTSIDMADTVKEIGDRAFYGCTNLEDITIPNSIEAVGIDAFDLCNKLEYTADGTFNYLGNEQNEYLYLANTKDNDIISVNDPDDIASANINENCKFIGYSAFSSCKLLESVKISGSVISIGAQAFADCIVLESVEISNSVTSVGENAFANCPIESATVATSALAFVKNTQLKDVVLTSGDKINTDAFNGCVALASVEIPASVTSIGANAFYGCNALTKVNYLGTIDNWATMQFDNSYANPVYFAKSLYLADTLAENVVLESVEAISNYAFYNCSSIVSIEIPASVTTIGNSAFYNCNSLASVSLTDKVESIGLNAFSNCSSLTNISVASENANYKSLDGNLYSKDGETLIQYAIGNESETFDIPTGVINVSPLAFSGCQSLKELSIPDSVTNISDNAFENCFIEKATIPADAYSYVINEQLKEVIIASGESINANAFYECTSLTSITIANSVTSIGASAFKGCTSLEIISLSNNLASIADDVFSGCSALKELLIPDSVTSIGINAFEGCILLESITLSNTLKNIAVNAFNGCSALQSITLPNTLEAIGKDAFDGCDGLEKVNYLGTIDKWVSIDFANENSNPVSYSKNLYINEILVENVVLETAKSISTYAFYNCSSIVSVQIPEGVTKISKGAFYNCTSLVSIEIPKSVTSIGLYVFSSCTSLTSITVDAENTKYQSIAGNLYNKNNKTFTLMQYAIGKTETTFTIPEGVKTINAKAFYNCSSLVSIQIPASVTTINESAFSCCASLTSITVDAENSKFKDVDGNLYSKDGETLIQYAIGKTDETFVIAKAVKKVSAGAFANCTTLTTINCEATSQPTGWEEGWNEGCSAQINWGYTIEE